MSRPQKIIPPVKGDFQSIVNAVADGKGMKQTHIQPQPKEIAMNMSLKQPKYILHLYGKGGLGEHKQVLDGLASMPNIRAGDYIAMKFFDYQYEHSDRAIVTETLWDFLGTPEQPEIHLYVKCREETGSEAAERHSRNKGPDV
jgi:hypothetical protein